jgi:very-short-patch-repair endonuclease
MKANGTYGKSRHEDELHEFLLRHFPDIQRQVDINGWSIDFYIPSIDVYLQLDGVYWHGLNRPREDIESSSNPRDKVIFETMGRDVRQNEWFGSNEKKLVRVTDLQDFEEILKMLR